MTIHSPARTVSIRRALPEDLPEIHRMLLALSPPHEGQAITRRRLERIAQGRAARLLVAHRDDSPQRYPVGFVLLLVTRNMITGTEWGFVEQLYVQEPDRHRGIGRDLIAAARGEAARAGCRGVTVRSRPDTDADALVFRAERPLDAIESQDRAPAA